MAEVFTIAGAPYLGAASCPVGFTPTPNGNCGGPAPSYRHPAASALQSALTVLAQATGDASLNVTNDGIIGPETTAAVNRAMTAHVGPGQAAAALRTGALDLGGVAANAPALAQAINAEAARRGASVPGGDLTVPDAGTVAARTSPGVMWGLVGLNLVLAGVGFYMTFGNEESEPAPSRRRASGRRAAYA